MNLTLATSGEDEETVADRVTTIIEGRNMPT
jgi:hypothetical protein